MTTKPSVAQLSLHTRIGLVLTALSAVLVLALGGLWINQSRNSINEEVTAAARVAEQWLAVDARELRMEPSDANRARLLAKIHGVGRIRANALEVLDAAGERRYLSPPPTYKAGRWAPVWFAALVEPKFVARRIDAGTLTLILHPDASRATLDAWDDLCAMAGWASVLLLTLFIAVRHALKRALRPLGQVMAALDRTGQGCFDTRLPVFPEPELGRLAKAFNGMADRLAQAVNHNVRLESERELAERLRVGLEAERRHIARELHDELAQGITAVRALAGAIAQRTGAQPVLHGPAQSIIAVTGQMQDGVRAVLQRLRGQHGDASLGVDEALRRYLQVWQHHYPDIALHTTLAASPAPLCAALARTVLRIVQEGLTNVVRHAAATRVEVTLRRLHGGREGWLELVLADNGCSPGVLSPAAGCGFGLAGMRERVATLGGELTFDIAADGARLCARLPAINITPVEDPS